MAVSAVVLGTVVSDLQSHPHSRPPPFLSLQGTDYQATGGSEVWIAGTGSRLWESRSEHGTWILTSEM